MQGTALNKEQQPVAGAGILIKKDTSLIRSGITDETGQSTGSLANTALKDGRPTFDINTTDFFMLPNDFSAEAGFFYQAGQLYGFMDVQPLWVLNLGVQKHYRLNALP